MNFSRRFDTVSEQINSTLTNRIISKSVSGARNINLFAYHAKSQFKTTKYSISNKKIIRILRKNCEISCCSRGEIAPWCLNLINLTIMKVKKNHCPQKTLRNLISHYQKLTLSQGNNTHQCLISCKLVLLSQDNKITSGNNWRNQSYVKITRALINPDYEKITHKLAPIGKTANKIFEQ